MSDLVSEVIPMPITVLAAEVSGVMLGVMPFGILLAKVARRSATTWRLRYTSVPSLKITVTTESPGIDCERISSMPTVPEMLCSIGWLTNDSTRSVESPGASV